MLEHASLHKEPQDLVLVEPVFTLLDLLTHTSKAQDVAKIAESLTALKQKAELAAKNGVSVDEASGVGNKRIQSVEEFARRMQELSSEKCAAFRVAEFRDG